LLARLPRPRAERARLSETLAENPATRVIALHPGIARAFRKAVEQTTRSIAGDSHDSRAARTALRNLVSDAKEMRSGVQSFAVGVP